MLMAEAFMLEATEEGFYNSAEPYLNLWASKLLLHKRDYASKSFRCPPLAADTPDEVFKYAKPPEKAEFWIFIDPATGPGTFSWVCNIFGVDVERVKSKIQPDWRILYGNLEPLAFETPSKITLQHIPHAPPVAKTDSETFNYEIPHLADFKSSVFTGRNTRTKQV